MVRIGFIWLWYVPVMDSFDHSNEPSKFHKWGVGVGVGVVRCVRFRASQFEICGGQSGTERNFSPSTSIFPCQYHSTIAPLSSSYTCCCYKKDKRTKPGNLPKSNPPSEIGCKKYLHLVFRGLRQK